MSIMSREFGYSHRDRAPLTEEELRNAAPSLFASGPHESRSERYGYVSTFDIVQQLMAQDFKPVAVQQSRSRHADRVNFTKHMVRMRAPGGENAKRGDSIAELALLNSHDGSSAFQAMAGIYRLTCDNGAMVADSLIQAIKIGHSGKIGQKVIDAMWSISEQAYKVPEVIDAWSGIELQAPMRHEFAARAHALRFGETSEATQKAITPDMLLERRREEDKRIDLWTLFNVVQENIVRGGLSGLGTVVHGGREQVRRISTRPIRSVTGDVGINRELFEMTERFAEEVA